MNLFRKFVPIRPVIVFRGIYLRSWVRWRFTERIPREFMCRDKNIPRHVGIDGYPIGPGGSEIEHYPDGGFKKLLKVYDKWTGRVFCQSYCTKRGTQVIWKE